MGNPFRRVLGGASPAKGKAFIPSSSQDGHAKNVLPEVVIIANNHDGTSDGHGEPSSSSTHWNRDTDFAQLPETTFPSSPIMPHLAKRFTLLRAPDGSMVTPDAMRAHLRAQRARARATGAPSTQCFLTEEEEDEIIDQLQTQTQNKELDMMDESYDSLQLDNNSHSSDFGGSDGFGSWAAPEQGDSLSNGDRRGIDGKRRMNLLAESLGELNTSDPEEKQTTSENILPSYGATRDQAYFSELQKPRFNRDAAQLSTIESVPEGLSVVEEATEEGFEDESGIRNSLNQNGRAKEPRNALSLQDDPNDEDKRFERPDSHRQVSRQSQLLTNLTPEAFNRVSTALEEVYSLVNGRVDDLESDNEDEEGIDDSAIQSSAQIDPMQSRIHRRALWNQEAYEDPRAGDAHQDTYGDDVEEEEELVDSDDGRSGQRQRQKSVDSFISAHSDVNALTGSSSQQWHHPVSGTRSIESQENGVPSDDRFAGSDNERRAAVTPSSPSTARFVNSNDNEVLLAPTGWTSVAGDAKSSVQVDDGEAGKAGDISDDSLVAPMPGALDPTSFGVSGGSVTPKSDSSIATRPRTPTMANDGQFRRREDAALTAEKQSLSPLFSALPSKHAGQGANTSPQQDPNVAASPLFAGLHFAGIGDRKSAIAAATAAGVAASSYVAQAQAQSRAQKQSLDEQRQKALLHSTSSQEELHPIEQDRDAAIGQEILSAGPSQVASSNARSGGDTVMPGSMGGVSLASPPSSHPMRPWALPHAHTASSAESEVLSADAIAARNPHYFPQSSNRISQYANGFKLHTSPVTARAPGPSEPIVALNLNGDSHPEEHVHKDDHQRGTGSPESMPVSHPSSASLVPNSAAAMHQTIQLESTPYHSPSKATQRRPNGVPGDKVAAPKRTLQPSPDIVDPQVPDTRPSTLAGFGHDDTEDTALEEYDEEDVWARVARNARTPSQQSQLPVVATNSEVPAQRGPVSLEHLREIQSNLVRSATSRHQQTSSSSSGDSALMKAQQPKVISAPADLPLNAPMKGEEIIHQDSSDSQYPRDSAQKHGDTNSKETSSESDAMNPFRQRTTPTKSRSTSPEANNTLLKKQGSSPEANNTVFKKPNSPTESNLERDTSTRSFRSQVMYDVTNSHRPTSPFPRTSQGSATGLPSLQDLQRNSIEADRSASLIGVVEQANQLSRKLHSRAEDGISDTSLQPASPGADVYRTFPLTIPEEQDEVLDGKTQAQEENEVSSSEARTTSQSNDSQTKPHQAEAGKGMYSGDDNLIHGARTLFPSEGVPDFASGPDLSLGVAWRAPAEKSNEAREHHDEDILEDVAEQARLATLALKGPNASRPSLLNSSLSKKARNRLTHHISQPDLVSTSQRLDHADPIDRPDKALRRKELPVFGQSKRAPPATGSSAIPIHPLEAKARERQATRLSPLIEQRAEVSRHPMKVTTRNNSGPLLPTDYRAASFGKPQDTQRSVSFGSRTVADGDVSKKSYLDVGSKNNGRAQESHVNEREEVRGLGRIMSRIRSSRKSSDALRSVEPVAMEKPIIAERSITPTSLSSKEYPSGPNHPGFAERRSRRIAPKRSTSSLSNTGADNSAQASSVTDRAIASKSPPPRSSSHSKKKKASVRSRTVSPTQDRNGDRPTVSSPPPHARIRSPPPASAEPPLTPPKPTKQQSMSSRLLKDITSADAGQQATLPSPQAKKSARDTILRRTLIVSTFEPPLDAQRGSIMSSRQAHTTAANDGGSVKVQSNSSSPVSKRASRTLSTGAKTSALSQGGSDKDSQNQELLQSSDAKPEGLLPSASSQSLNVSANTSLAVPDRTNSLRASTVSGYGPSFFDDYCAEREGNTVDESIMTHSQYYQPTNRKSIAASRKSVFEAGRANGTRHIEVTERADGSVVWQVIAGLADRSSSYSTSFAFDQPSRRGSESSHKRDSRVSVGSRDGVFGLKPNELVTSEEGRSLFAHSRATKQAKSHPAEMDVTPPALAGMVSNGVNNSTATEAFQAAFTHGSHGLTQSASQGSIIETGPNGVATRIVYTSDAELAAMLEKLAGPDKSSAKFAFQRADEGYPISSEENGGQDSGFSHGKKDTRDPVGQQHTIGINTQRGAGGGGGWRGNRDSVYDRAPAATGTGIDRPISVLTEADMTGDATGALREQRSKIEAEIYNLLQRDN